MSAPSSPHMEREEFRLRSDFSFALCNPRFSDRTLRVHTLAPSSPSARDDGTEPQSLLESVREVPVSSVVLAANSGFFERMFSGDFQEGESKGDVDVHLESASVECFMEMLHFLYTGTLSPSVRGSFEAALDLLVLSDRFEAQACFLSCVRALSWFLPACTMEKAILVLSLPQSMQEDRALLPLVEAALKRLVSSGCLAVQKASTSASQAEARQAKEMLLRSPDFGLKILLQAKELRPESEELVAEAAFAWALHNFTDPQAMLDALFSLIVPRLVIRSLAPRTVQGLCSLFLRCRDRPQEQEQAPPRVGSEDSLSSQGVPPPSPATYPQQVLSGAGAAPHMVSQEGGLRVRLTHGGGGEGGSIFEDDEGAGRERESDVPSPKTPPPRRFRGQKPIFGSHPVSPVRRHLAGADLAPPETLTPPPPASPLAQVQASVNVNVRSASPTRLSPPLLRAHPSTSSLGLSSNVSSGPSGAKEKPKSRAVPRHFTRLPMPDSLGQVTCHASCAQFLEGSSTNEMLSLIQQSCEGCQMSREAAECGLRALLDALVDLSEQNLLYGGALPQGEAMQSWSVSRALRRPERAEPPPTGRIFLDVPQRLCIFSMARITYGQTPIAVSAPTFASGRWLTVKVEHQGTASDKGSSIGIYIQRDSSQVVSHCYGNSNAIKLVLSIQTSQSRPAFEQQASVVLHDATTSCFVKEISLRGTAFSQFFPNNLLRLRVDSWVEEN